MDTTATELRNALRGAGDGCDAVMRDYVYFNMLSAFPPTRSAGYVVTKDCPVYWTKDSPKSSVDLMVYDGEGSYHMFQTALEKQGDVLNEVEWKALRQRAEDTAAQQLNECYAISRDDYPEEQFRSSDRFYRWVIAGVFHGYGDQSDGYVGQMSIGVRLIGISTL